MGKKEKNNIESESRRKFLKKSSFAAYAAPTMTLLVIESAAAKPSGGKMGAMTTGMGMR